MYEYLLAAHILAVIAWVGGALTFQLLAFRALRSNEPQQLVLISRQAEFVGPRLFGPASGLALLFGILLVLNGHWGFGHFWILFGLGVLLLSAITGSSVLGPEFRRVGKLLEAQAPDHAEVRTRLERIFFFARVDLVLLLLVVVDMVIKPFG